MKITDRKIITAVLAAACAAVLCAFTALAGVTVTSTEEPAAKKTITWTCSEPATEYRYLEGTHGEADFCAAHPAGTEEGSATVTDNGNYTLYAAGDGFLSFCVYPVTFIDRNSPDIAVTDVYTSGDGKVDVEFTASDYFSPVEVRIVSGEAGISAFGDAAPVTGNRLEGLTPGTYTLLARDSAGNISGYTLHAGETHGIETETEVETSEWSLDGSNEWHGSEISLSRGTASLTVRKVDAATGADLPDAKLTLIDRETGFVKDEWVTNGTPHKVADVIPGRTLILRESCFPKGYRKASDIEFTPLEGEELTIVMEDEPDGTPETAAPPETPPDGRDRTGGSPTVAYDGERTTEAPAVTDTAPAAGQEKSAGKVTAKLDRDPPGRLPQTGLDGTGRLEMAALAALLLGILGLAAVRSEKKKNG